jgi:eukaryotic-like serine/threonine-protein kinase
MTMARTYWKFSALYIVVAAIVLCLAIVTSLTIYLPKQIVAEAERSTHAKNATVFSLYDNKTLGIKILYPSNWEKLEGAGSFVFNPDVVVFRSHLNASNSNQKSNATQQIPPAVLVVSIDKNLPISDLKIYSNATIKHILENTVGSKIIESTDTKLAGYPAHKIVGTFRQANNDLKVLDIWTIKDSKLYRITFYAQQTKYADYLPTIQKMIDSFQIS